MSTFVTCAMTAMLALVLAGSLPGCAASSQPSNAPARTQAASARANPPDPAQERGPWHAPLPVSRGAAQLAWVATEAPSLCHVPVNTGPVVRVDDEADFEALFCRSSDVDWRRLQLYWYRLALTSGRALLTEDVVSTESRIDWLLVPEACADRPGGYAPAPAPAILILRNDWPVVARTKPELPADCPATNEGYGY